jgi:hypothetical protein
VQDAVKKFRNGEKSTGCFLKRGENCFEIKVKKW